jgi:hypothetical protein
MLKESLTFIIPLLRDTNKRLLEIQSYFIPALNNIIDTLQSNIENELSQSSFTLMSLKNQNSNMTHDITIGISILRTITIVTEMNDLIDSLFGAQRYENANEILVEAFSLIENLNIKLYNIKSNIFKERAKLITNFTDIIYS